MRRSVTESLLLVTMLSLPALGTQTMASNASLNFVYRGALRPHSLCFMGASVNARHEFSVPQASMTYCFILSSRIASAGVVTTENPKRTVGRWEMHFRHGGSKMGECNRGNSPLCECCPAGNSRKLA